MTYGIPAVLLVGCVDALFGIVFRITGIEVEVTKIEIPCQSNDLSLVLAILMYLGVYVTSI